VHDNSRRDAYAYTAEVLEQKAMPPFASIITVMIGPILSIRIGIAAGSWIP
jgi:hypothetical protein